MTNFTLSLVLYDDTETFQNSLDFFPYKKRKTLVDSYALDL